MIKKLIIAAVIGALAAWPVQGQVPVTGAGLANANSLPQVDINFAAGTATGCSSTTSCISVTRTTTETCEGPGQTVTYATSGNACITAAGLQSYEAGTNLIPQSQAITGWGTTNATFTAAGTAPDGIATAMTLTDNNTSGVHVLGSANVSLTAGTLYTISLYAKAGTCTGSTFECDLIGIGPAASFGNSGLVDVDLRTCTEVASTSYNKHAQIISLASGWCHIYYTTTVSTSTSNTAITVGMLNVIPNGGSKSNSYVGGGSTVLIWGAQIEATGAFLPYCKTSGASATCNKDVLADTSTLQTDLEKAAVRVVATVVQAGWASPGPILGVGTALYGMGWNAGWQGQTSWPTTATIHTAGQIVPGAFTNYIGFSGDGSGRSMAINGQTAVSDSNAISATAQEYLGSLSTGTNCDCVISELKVWTTRNDAAMLTATNNANILALVASYTGTVATNVRISQSLLASATATQAMSRSHHIATENITTLAARFPNYYVQNNSTETEIGPGGSTTITASIEYPAGSCTQLLFSGSASGTITNISNLLSDQLTLAIPAGADFWVRAYRTNSNGIVAVGLPTDTVNGATMTTGTSGVVDSTVTCTGGLTNTNASFEYSPDAIVGPTQLRSYCLLGDSRETSFNATYVDIRDLVGEQEGWVGWPNYSTLNMGAGGDQAQKFIASNTNRKPLLAYCTGMMVNLGVNDAVNARTAVQIEGNLQTIYGYDTSLEAGSGPVWQTTIMGETTSSDSWTTTGNQTAVSANTIIATLDAWIRANTAAITGYFEVSVSYSSAATQDSIWNANATTTFGWTKDGIHPDQLSLLTLYNTRGRPALQ